MKVGVNISINVSMIEKARLYQRKKGKYLDMTTFIDLDQKDQYDNNGFISQNVSKDEKEQGVKGPILGNCKVFWSDCGQSQQSIQKSQQQAPADGFDDDLIPF